jgi:hypothetical protein
MIFLMGDRFIALGEDLEAKLWKTSNAAARIVVAKRAIAVYAKALLKSSYDTDRQLWIGRRIKKLDELIAADYASLVEVDGAPTKVTLGNLDRFVDFYWNIDDAVVSLAEIFMMNYTVVMDFIA